MTPEILKATLSQMLREDDFLQMAIMRVGIPALIASMEEAELTEEQKAKVSVGFLNRIAPPVTDTPEEESRSF